MKKKITLILTLIIIVIASLFCINQNKKLTDETVNIAFTIDNNYVLGAGIAMSSILKNTNSKTKFFIVENGLTEKNKVLLKYYAKFHGSEVEYIHKNTDEFIGVYKHIPYITPIVMARLFLPEILPKNISRVIYLDADILVIDDIKKLYNAKLYGKPLGMVRPSKHKDYNDGVILMDLDKWREQEFTKKLIDYYYEENVVNNVEKYKYPDQDLINILLKKDTHNLPNGWNTNGGYDWDFLDRNNASMLFSLYHYFGGIKPWYFIKRDLVGYNEYQKYWNRSIFVIVKPYYLALYIKYLIENKEDLINNLPIIKKKIQKEFKKSYEIPNYQFKYRGI